MNGDKPSVTTFQNIYSIYKKRQNIRIYWRQSSNVWHFSDTVHRGVLWILRLLINSRYSALLLKAQFIVSRLKLPKRSNLLYMLGVLLFVLESEGEQPFPGDLNQADISPGNTKGVNSAYSQNLILSSHSICDVRMCDTAARHSLSTWCTYYGNKAAYATYIDVLTTEGSIHRRIFSISHMS